MREKGQFFLLEHLQFINVEGIREIENYHQNTDNYCRQEPLMDAKING